MDRSRSYTKTRFADLWLNFCVGHNKEIPQSATAQMQFDFGSRLPTRVCDSAHRFAYKDESARGDR